MITFLSLLALAITPTPTPEILPTKTDDIQKIRQAVQQKVLEKLRQITSDTEENQTKGFFGTATTIDTDEIVIDHNSNLRHLKITADTVYIDIKRNKAKTSTIKIGQGLLALGRLDGDQNLEAKRLVAIDLESTKPKDQIIFGQITDTSQTSPVFTLIPLNNKDQQFQIKTTTTTESYGPQKQKFDVKKLVKGHRVVAVIKTSTAGTYTAVTLIDLDYTLPTTPSPSPTVASAKAGTPTKKP